MNASDEMSAVRADTAPLSDTMMAMDVADTLRHNGEAMPAGDDRDSELIEQLRATYQRQGIEVPDAVLREGLTALGDSRFVYTPPKAGAARFLAELYIVRRRWLPAVTGLLIALVIGLGGYFLVYRPLHQSQIEQAELELTQGMPAQMDALYQSIFNETKVQQASNDAADDRDRGKDAARRGDRAGAQAAIDDLAFIRDTLRAEYQLHVVDHGAQKWGFWSFPKDNSDATNYYLVVEALDSQNKPVSLPVRDENTGKTATVSQWGLRVPEDVYRSYQADKSDDGKIEQTLVGIKEFGFLDTNFLIQTLGGTVTQW